MTIHMEEISICMVYTIHIPYIYQKSGPRVQMDLAPRGSGDRNCGFQEVCVAAVTPSPFKQVCCLNLKAINFFNARGPARRRFYLDPENCICQLLQRPLKMCTIRRAFKLLLQHQSLNKTVPRHPAGGPWGPGANGCRPCADRLRLRRSLGMIP